jgi:cell division topological specificity factor
MVGLKNDEQGSKDVAKERLQFILVHDRINLSPEEMKNMREELRDVINKYLEIDDENVKMEVNQKEEVMALIANFPLNNST